MKKRRTIVEKFAKKRIELLLFLLLIGVYAYTFPRWADPNQNSRLNMVVAVVEDGTFRIDPYVSNTVDYAKVGDHYYSDKAPGAAFLGIPSLCLDEGIPGFAHHSRCDGDLRGIMLPSRRPC
jgi:hypothetical protein